VRWAYSASIVFSYVRTENIAQSMSFYQEWLADYVQLISSESDPEVDMDATRDALLVQLPKSRDEANWFWSRVKDETEAELLLQSLLEEVSPQVNEMETIGEKRAREALELFLQLPYQVQLQKLVDMGTLRPLLDEYTKESDRIKFMNRYGEILLEGVEVEHLVLDPDGAITVDDIGDDDYLVGNEQVGKDARFSIQMIPYGTDEYGTTRGERARALYRAWSMQKAGRAQYEGRLFKKGYIGLTEK